MIAHEIAKLKVRVFPIFTPIACAEISLSRTAAKLRPRGDLRIFLYPMIIRTVIAKINQYSSATFVYLSKFIPKMLIAGAYIPPTPPVQGSKITIKSSANTPIAMVAIAM